MIDEASIYFYCYFSRHLLESLHTVLCFGTRKDSFINGDIEKKFSPILRESIKSSQVENSDSGLIPSRTMDCYAVNRESGL